MPSIEYLDEERQKLWAKILELEKELNKRIPEAEREAKQDSKKASEFRNRAEEAKDATLKSSADAAALLSSIETSHTYIENIKNEIATLHSSAIEKSKGVDDEYEALTKRKEELTQQVSDLNEIFEDEENINSKLEKLEEASTSAADQLSKISVAHKNSLERRKEIDELYYEIIGYTETDDNGNPQVIPGMRDELANSYKDTKSKIDELFKDVEQFSTQYEAQYATFTDNKDADYKTRFSQWEKEYKGISDKIKTLLPAALTAGLSAAYSKKKEEEVKESQKYDMAFQKAVFGMIGISSLPFIVSVYEFFADIPLDQILLGIPRLALAILPLYVPVLWLAYSANKKRNLSKRLIEEYTHKEVLSKTYEGLSAQINEIEDKVASSELRNRLLYNILEISAENPGKLISDYQKSDHPLMEALEKSVQLGNAVDKLGKIPGFGRLARAVEKKSADILHRQSQMANAGLDMLDEKEQEDKEANKEEG